MSLLTADLADEPRLGGGVDAVPAVLAPVHLYYESRGAKRNKSGNVWVFVQPIIVPGWSLNQLYKNPNIA